jgi:hypothetical protein
MNGRIAMFPIDTYDDGYDAHRKCVDVNDTPYDEDTEERRF